MSTRTRVRERERETDRERERDRQRERVRERAEREKREKYFNAKHKLIERGREKEDLRIILLFDFTIFTLLCMSQWQKAKSLYLEIYAMLLFRRGSTLRILCLFYSYVRYNGFPSQKINIAK